MSEFPDAQRPEQQPGQRPEQQRAQQPEQQPDRTDIERTQRLVGERYQLSWIIGRGGMSTVWLARDTQNDRDVALKILKPEYTENDEFRTRFRNEATHAQHFNSPNVVATYDYQEVRDQGAVFCFIVMEYVRGEPLSDILKRERRLPAKLALDVLAQTAVGLATIHAAGMVHRDIKPGNLLITHDGVVKVTDFGIAKAAEAVPLTRTGMVVGTAQYVSPEQAQGSQVTAASDVYSAGVVGYEMLAGRRPFTGDSTVSIAIQHIRSAPEPLPDDVPVQARELINICLAKNAAARYADGEELATATALAAAGQHPPQPDHVPSVDAAEAPPRTQHIGRVVDAQQGTAVPPRQGPRRAAPVSSGRQRSSQSSSPIGWLVTGSLVVLALAIGAFMWWNSSSDSENPGSETMTVTNEVTTSAPSEPTTVVPAPPPTSSSRDDEGDEDNRRTTERSERPEPSSSESSPSTRPSSPAEQPSSPTSNPAIPDWNLPGGGDETGGEEESPTDPMTELESRGEELTELGRAIRDAAEP